MRDQRGVRCGRADHGQVGRHLLVALDELVALGAAQPAGVGELLEPLPLVRVREHVRVEIHATKPRVPG